MSSASAEMLSALETNIPIELKLPGLLPDKNLLYFIYIQPTYSLIKIITILNLVFITPLYLHFLIDVYLLNYTMLLFSCQVLSDSFATPSPVLQSPLSVGFPRQEYWSGLPFHPPGDLPD